MASRQKRKRHQRIRGKTTRKVRTTLGVAGAVMLLIGAGAIIWGGAHGIPTLRLVGAVYILVGVGVLAVRQAMVAISAARLARDEDATDQHGESDENASVKGVATPGGTGR